MAKLNNTNKGIIETMAELTNMPNMKLGIDEIEFPDGTREKFFYNGEEDRQAAITFAQICYDATHDTMAAKQMMVVCFSVLTNGSVPTAPTVRSNGTTYYMDHKRKLLCDQYGNIIVDLDDDEKKIKDKFAITRLLEEKGNRYIENACDYGYDEDGEW